MTTDQCKSIDKALKSNVLCRMRVVRTAPDAVAFSTTKFGGIGLHRTEVDQTIDHAKMIIQHGHRETVTGVLLTLEQISVESGLGGNPFAFDANVLTYTTKRTWIEHTIRSFQKYDIYIEPNFQGLSKWTSKDNFIMDKATRVISVRELQTSNKVRIFLQVATTSDPHTQMGA